jgi:DNA-binding CsgD family transcriptional regulator
LLNNTNRISTVKQGYQKAVSLGIPMGPRLFLFLVVLVLTMMIGAAAILIITGTFSAGMSDIEKTIEKELPETAGQISSDFGKLSLEAVEFSEALSTGIEEQLRQLGIQAGSLKEHPALLEEVIADQYRQALFFLHRSQTSGVFFILDATVNPALANAAYSRAGLYIKNIEPNIISSSSPNISILRGFASIGRKNSMNLHAQWKMEFDVSDAPYYYRPIETAVNRKELPLSRLYFWTHAKLLDTSEEVLLCSVPLVDSKGNVFGVCGLEVSAMLFKLSYMPAYTEYNQLFCMLSPQADSKGEAAFLIQNALFAGGYSTRAVVKSESLMQIESNSKSFYTYRQDTDTTFFGSHTPISLYPNDSAYLDEKWAAAVMMPEEEVKRISFSMNFKLLFLLLLLVLMGIAVSLVLSIRYIKPISKGFDIIKSNNLTEAPKTKVPEIDDLIEFLSSHSEELKKKAEQDGLSLSILDDFLANTKKLSPAEQSVFNLYVKGYTAKEIADALFLSINTIKTHNKRIYSKLNVGSREELLLYVNMLKELGRDFE